MTTIVSLCEVELGYVAHQMMEHDQDAKDVED